MRGAPCRVKCGSKGQCPILQNVYSLFLSLTAVPFNLPVLRAAMSPTFCPGAASLLTVEACPICWWLPPPWGCSTGFIATPRTWNSEELSKNLQIRLLSANWDSVLSLARQASVKIWMGWSTESLSEPRLALRTTPARLKGTLARVTGTLLSLRSTCMSQELIHHASPQ